MLTMLPYQIKEKVLNEYYRVLNRMALYLHMILQLLIDKRRQRSLMN